MSGLNLPQFFSILISLSTAFSVKGEKKAHWLCSLELHRLHRSYVLSGLCIHITLMANGWRMQKKHIKECGSRWQSILSSLCCPGSGVCLLSHLSVYLFNIWEDRLLYPSITKWLETTTSRESCALLPRAGLYSVLMLPLLCSLSLWGCASLVSER